MRPAFEAFHFMTSNDSSWVCCIDLLPEGESGECDPNTHVIRISPRNLGQMFLDDLIHEFLHAEVETWRHRKICLTAGVLSTYLHALGYRNTGPRLPVDADKLKEVLGDMINQVARDLDGTRIRAMAGAMAVYLSNAGFRRLRRSGHGRRQRDQDLDHGGSGYGKHGSRSGRGGRGKRNKKIGFVPPEGPPAAAEP